MIIVKGDITKVVHGFVCHQVNCMGVMGAGVALAIRNKWPIVYTEYIQAFKEGKLKLGNIVFVHVDNRISVINLCGQYNYGYKGIRTDYKALDVAIQHVGAIKNKMESLLKIEIPVYFPENMGCGLAGGDWKVVSKIIEKYIPDATIVNYEK